MCSSDHKEHKAINVLPHNFHWVTSGAAENHHFGDDRVIADGKRNPEVVDETSDEQEIWQISQDRLVFKKNPNTHFSSSSQPKMMHWGIFFSRTKRGNKKLIFRCTEGTMRNAPKKNGR